MKKSVLFFIFCLFLCFAQFCFAEEKIGFVNLKQLISESKEGRAAALELEKWSLAERNRLARKRSELEEFKRLLEAEAPQMPEDKRIKKFEELQNGAKAYERELEDSKENYKKKEALILKVVLEKAQDAVTRVGKKHDFSMILMEPKIIGYINPGLT